MDMKLAKLRWHQQKMNARRRKIPWKLTFEDWLQIWLDSGQYKNRGRGRGKYCMARYNDKGAYRIGNVEIVLDADNRRESSIRGNAGQFKKGHIAAPHVLKKVSIATKRRWRKYRKEKQGL